MAALVKNGGAVLCRSCHLIFVTVGLQEPFDRLIRGVDVWASQRGRSDVFAQIGNAKYVPRHMRFTDFVDPLEFQGLLYEASLVVAHAGIGSILSALELGRPIVVMPRLARLREQRNDHQSATAKRFEGQGLATVAYDEQALGEKLDYALKLENPARLSNNASPELIAAIRSFLADEPA
jgi:UDP-N-acetylglucosamine transferase subunit ALG13